MNVCMPVFFCVCVCLCVWMNEHLAVISQLSRIVMCYQQQTTIAHFVTIKILGDNRQAIHKLEGHSLLWAINHTIWETVHWPASVKKHNLFSNITHNIWKTTFGNISEKEENISVASSLSVLVRSRPVRTLVPVLYSMN